jgi:hypothetical protein
MIKRYEWDGLYGEFRDRNGEPCDASAVVSASDYDAMLREQMDKRAHALDRADRLLAKLGRSIIKYNALRDAVLAAHAAQAASECLYLDDDDEWWERYSLTKTLAENNATE